MDIAERIPQSTPIQLEEEHEIGDLFTRASLTKSLNFHLSLDLSSKSLCIECRSGETSKEEVDQYFYLCPVLFFHLGSKKWGGRESARTFDSN